MKKYILLILSLAVLCLSACGAAAEGKKANSAVSSAGEENEELKRLHIVTTVFPEYDWTREILGDARDDAELTLLLDSSVDLHSYQPSAEDIARINSCDLFIYEGGESDGWVKDVLRDSGSKDRRTINLMEVLGSAVKEEELIEGMEADHGEEEHEHNTDEHDGEPEYDEHVWLSLRNAKVICRALADTLSEIDPENADIYENNAAEYVEKLENLDSEYENAVKSAAKKTLLFGDRFPFRYLTDDYGLSYYAAFAGCSAETEASFETIVFLAGKVDELGLGNVLTLEKSDKKIAETIIRNTRDKAGQILTMDSLQSVSREDIDGGITYLSVMEKNLDVLKDALK